MDFRSRRALHAPGPCSAAFGTLDLCLGYVGGGCLLPRIFRFFSSPPTLSANSQMPSVDNSQSANSQIRHFKKLFFLDTHARRPRGTEKPSEGHCSSRLIESFSRNSRDFTICRCKFSNHLRICTFGDLRICNFQAGRMSGSDGFWSLDSGSACGGRTGGRREAVPTHVCGVSCVSRAISGGDANSQMSEFENLHRFSQNLNLRKTHRRFLRDVAI